MKNRKYFLIVDLLTNPDRRPHNIGRMLARSSVSIYCQAYEFASIEFSNPQPTQSAYLENMGLSFDAYMFGDSAARDASDVYGYFLIQVN